MEPSRIQVPDSQLADGRARPRNTSWPNRDTVSDWSQGTPHAYLRELVDNWLNRYDRRARKPRMSAVSQFRTKVARLGIHVYHPRCAHPDTEPLVLAHG
jgi:hypothetical protein